MFFCQVREDLDISAAPIIAEIVATDSDIGPNGAVRYAITGGNDRGTFGIDPETGRLSVVKGLDFESARQYHLTVRAQDGGAPPKSNTTTVYVKVSGDHIAFFLFWFFIGLD